MEKIINIPIFLISLALGLFIMYITQPKPTKIFVYPTPDNLDKIQYVDRADNCFSFDYQKISCPKDSNQIKEIPVQN